MLKLQNSSVMPPSVSVCLKYHHSEASELISHAPNPPPSLSISLKHHHSEASEFIYHAPNPPVKIIGK